MPVREPAGETANAIFSHQKRDGKLPVVEARTRGADRVHGVDARRHLRHSSYTELRDDKDPAQIVRE